ncbi:hypothetical protein [Geodermatophilus marinus]|uniref:hypothetical protein n=1 Tax=Geodermatophilus sp. LHW52908 TaxID=2303986 RepID=UPI000E3E90D7|nr:hypothetical protein [Geodermatophilus sp. LHW52908]RFU19200.1 hypothetical protein D0Z06_22650 [Geodermatophilus sp. LHW52908]
MTDPAFFPTVLVDPRAPAAARPRPTPLPVARVNAEGAAGRLHLVDGDGASLCELIPARQLERLPLPWCDVVTTARCRVCAALAS